tara:strand:- start:5298 stop:5651 length:354 start_codon:yes stop_codon:yes gene_type:complete
MTYTNANEFGPNVAIFERHLVTGLLTAGLDTALFNFHCVGKQGDPEAKGLGFWQKKDDFNSYTVVFEDAIEFVEVDRDVCFCNNSPSEVAVVVLVAMLSGRPFCGDLIEVYQSGEEA